MRIPELVTWTCLGLASAGCLSVERRHPMPAAQPQVHTGEPVRAWRVQDQGEFYGEIICFSGREDREGELFVVRNRWKQDVGLIDRLGRAYRYLPHHKEPAWVGTGTLLQGARRILGAREEARLEETALSTIAEDGARAAIEASASEEKTRRTQLLNLPVRGVSAKSP